MFSDIYACTVRFTEQSFVGQRVKPAMGEPPEIETRLQKRRISANKTAMRLSLVVLIAYGCLRICHWLFDFPSLGTINAISISLSILWLLVSADLCIEILLAEFRMHLENLDQKTTAIQEKVNEISDAIHSSIEGGPRIH
jgi:hypothetical protein